MNELCGEQVTWLLGCQRASATMAALVGLAASGSALARISFLLINCVRQQKGSDGCANDRETVAVQLSCYRTILKYHFISKCDIK